MEGGGGRSWQRASSKNARGASNNRQLSQPVDQLDIDPMMSTVQKSHIASILQGARSTVGGGSNDLQRPFTPGDLPRHLFSGDDYSNRPVSSYKMKNIVGQAIDEFTSAVGNNQSMTTTHTTNISSSSKIPMPRAGSQNKDKNIINVLQKHDISRKPRGNALPALQPIQKDSLKNIGSLNKSSIKGFESNKPIKVQQVQSQEQNLNSSLTVTGVNTNIAKPIVKLKKPPASNQPDPSQQLKKQGKAETNEDFKEFLNEDARLEKIHNFDQSKMDNLIKMQEIQKQIKNANRQRDEEDKQGDEDDQYEDYFETQMLKDMEGVENYEQPIDYGEVLNTIQSKVKDIDQSVRVDEIADDMDDDYLTQSIAVDESKQGGYVAEYQEVINEMSKICGIISHNNRTEDKSRKLQLSESEIIELCPRIWTLATEHEKQPKDVQLQCFLETLLKGSFSLLAVKFPKAVLRLSACNIHLFLKIFDNYIQNHNHGTQADFSKLYNYLFETMKILLIYSKEGAHDELFKHENLIPQLSRVIHTCFLERSDVIIKLTSQVVNKKEIINDDLVYDLVNYTIGSIKCFTQSNVEVQKESIKQRYIMMLSKCMQKAMSFGTNMSKKAQMLVQICGALRNLSNDDSSYEQLYTNGVISKLIDILEQFKGHKELMLNVSRILSKISMDTDCCQAIIDTNKLCFMVDLVYEFQNFTSFLIRIAFVLANITTYFDEAREQIGVYGKSMERILQVSLYYFSKEETGEPSNDKKGLKKEETVNLGSVEDSLIKLIRLIANLCTDEKYTLENLKSQQDLINEFMDKMICSIQRKSLTNNEEFIFNAISCATNLLFYDTPHNQLFTQELREQLFNLFKSYMLVTTNEELQIEAVRVLSNLSRHVSVCQLFVSDKTFLEALCVILDHTLRDLVFYAIGIVINITLHEATRPQILEKGVIQKLIDVLKDSNIEDMELAKVSAKALHNIARENSYWSIEQIKKLDEILTNLGEELDSIMEVANDEELEEIKGLRDMVNALINDMPEPMYNCPDMKCGRKFKNKDELEKHIERRHNTKQ